MPDPNSQPHPPGTPSELARQQRRGFALITRCYIILLLASIAASWAAIEVVNGTRAYSTGEGRYSKAQKIAVLELHRYAYSRLPGDYEAFLAATVIPRGDRAARRALQLRKADTAAARQGFLRGDNHPDDVGDLILLFRLFSGWGPFAAAVAEWREGDGLVSRLIELGAQLNQRIADGTLDAATRTQLLASIDRVDDRLTSLENTFSGHMGEAARAASKMAAVGMVSVTILLWVIGMAFARRLLRAQLALAEREARELESANDLLLASSAELEAARERAEQEKMRAEKASNAKSDFLSKMSHELRTPLNSILGFAQLLELNTADPLTSRQTRQVVQIRKSGDHLLSLINDILDLSKIEAGNIKLSIEAVPLKPVLEQVHAALSPLADKAGIAITVDISEEGLIAHADRTRLLQVLMNLGNNALKYNRTGGRLTLAAEPAGDTSVRLLTSDTGQGIPIDRQNEVFQAFNRLGAEQGAIEGTGIGLSISRRLVHLMGGEISFTSVPNVGTTFTVDLPRWRGKTAASQELQFANVIDLSRRRRGYTLLYVEDNPSNIELMQGLIEALDGVGLLTATDPTIGLALADAHLPDVIVLDIDLPGMSGFEVLNRLRASPSTTSIPVIALSAAAMPRDIERGLAAGFTRYLTKPINVREFLTAIDSILAERIHVRHGI